MPDMNRKTTWQPGDINSLVDRFPNPMALEMGLLGWNASPFSATSQTTLTSQKIHLAPIWLNGNIPVNNLWVGVQTAASGTAPTSLTFAFVDAAGNVLGTSADVKAATLITAGGFGAVPLSAQAVTTAAGMYYVAFLKDGTYSVTEPQFVRFNAGLNSTINGKPMGAHGGTGKTAITGPLTITGSEIVYWCGVS